MIKRVSLNVILKTEINCKESHFGFSNSTSSWDTASTVKGTGRYNLVAMLLLDLKSKMSPELVNCGCFTKEWQEDVRLP